MKFFAKGKRLLSAIVSMALAVSMSLPTGTLAMGAPAAGDTFTDKFELQMQAEYVPGDPITPVADNFVSRTFSPDMGIVFKNPDPNVNWGLNTKPYGWKTTVASPTKGDSGSGYVVYEMKADITDFNVVFYDYTLDGTARAAAKLSASADGQDWQAVESASEDKGPTDEYTQNQHQIVLTPKSAVPAGLKFLKAEITSLGWGSSTAGFTQISITTGGEGEVIPPDDDPTPVQYTPGQDGSDVLKYTYPAGNNGYDDVLFRDISGLDASKAYTLCFSYKAADAALAGKLNVRAQVNWGGPEEIAAPADWAAYTRQIAAGSDKISIEIGGGDCRDKTGASILMDNVVLVDEDGSVFPLSNASFESGDLSGWNHQTNNGGAFAVVDTTPVTPPADGNHVLEYTVNNNWNTFVFQDVTLQAGVSYTFQADVKGVDAAVGAGVRLNVFAPNWDVQFGSGDWQSAADWKKLTYEFTAPADGVYHATVGGADAHGKTGLVYFDNVSLKADGGPELVQDGDFENDLTGWKLDNLHEMQVVAAEGPTPAPDPDPEPDVQEGYSHTGSWAMVRKASSQGFWDGPYQTVSLTAGTKYHMSAWFLTTSTADSHQINFRVIDGSWQGVGGGEVTVTGQAPDDWQRFDFYFTSSATANYTLQFMQNWTTTAPVYIDDVALYAYEGDDGEGEDVGSNLIANGGFEAGEENWSPEKLGNHNDSSSTFIEKFKTPTQTNAFIDDISSHSGSPFVFSKSDTMWPDTSVNACFPSGDARYRKADGVADGAATTDGWLKYQTSYDIHEFQITTYFWSDQKPTDLQISLSKDGQTWKTVEAQTYRLGGNATQWPRLLYEASGFDAGYRYLRIYQPDNPDMYSWALYIRQVAVNAYCSPVTADPPNMTKIEDTSAGMRVTLASPETALGGSIMYSLNNGTPVLYTEPILVKSPSVIEAYATGPNKEDSLHTKFTYPTAENEIVDEWGQIIHTSTSPEHPQLVHSTPELAYVYSSGSTAYPNGLTKKDYWNSMNSLSNDLLGQNSDTDIARDIYGGLAGSKAVFGFQATGYFHIEYPKIDGITKAVMADPLGNMFFSLGVTGVGSPGDTYTLTSGREYAYEWLPDKTDPAKLAQYGPAYMDANYDRFSFYVANRIKNRDINKDPTETWPIGTDGAAYNNFNTDAFYKEAVQRLKDWGFNTAGGFSYQGSDDRTFAKADFLGGWGGQIPGYTGVFDVFSQANYDAVVASASASAQAYKDRPDIMGLMVANELPYNQVCKAIAQQSASSCVSKQKMVDMLKAEYSDIAAFNTAWKQSFASWDTAAAQAISTGNAPQEDLNAFLYAYAKRFYQAYRDGWDQGGGRQMLIGDRWLVSIMSDNMGRVMGKAAGETLDAISYNYYADVVNVSKLQSIYDASKSERNNNKGIPIIVTEFHYGDLSTDQPFGIKPAKDTKEKGLKYSAYMQALAASGIVVGAHWFEYIDEAATSRWFDGENGSIGLLNVDDRPYVDFFGPDTAADINNASLSDPGAVYTNYNIYKYITGDLTPINAPTAPDADHTNNKTAGFVKVPGSASIDVDASPTLDSGYTGDPLTITYMDCVLGGTGMPGYGAQVSPAWDANNLYLHIHVDDPTPGCNSNNGSGIWNGDGIEVFIGPNPDEVDVNNAFLADDVQLLLNGALVNGHVDYYAASPNGAKNIQLDMALTYDASGKGYVVEVAVPWDQLGIAPPADGQKLRFDIGFDNANKSTAPGGGVTGRDRQYLWTGIDGNSRDRTYWGTATLLREKPVPVTVDKSKLQALVAKANGFAEADFTADSWNEMQQALTAANAVMADENATQLQIDQTAMALQNALDGLVALPKVDVGGEKVIIDVDKVTGAATIVMDPDDNTLKSAILGSGDFTIHLEFYSDVTIKVPAGWFKNSDQVITILTKNGDKVQTTKIKTKQLWNASGKTQVITIVNGKLQIKNTK